MMPDAEAPTPPLTPEQHARRLRLRRAVVGIVLGLLAFTALAACIQIVKDRAAVNSSAALDAKPVVTSVSESEPTRAPSSGPVVEPVAAALPSETDQALALAHAPVATLANFETWSRLAAQLSPADQHRAEHDLSRLSVKGTRPVKEAARLELALLWRATARRTKAQKVLLSLARTATDPLVKKYAQGTLTSV